MQTVPNTSSAVSRPVFSLEVKADMSDNMEDVVHNAWRNLTAR
jgi:hypothetical protein